MVVQGCSGAEESSDGLCATEGVEAELAATESQRPVLPLPLDGDGDESGDGWC